MLTKDLLSAGELSDIYAEVKLAKLRPDDEKGAWAAAYERLYQALTTRVLWDSPDQGVDEQVWTWLRGARVINAGDGLFSSMVRSYTSMQHMLRYGVPLTDAQLNEASNDVAERFFDLWLRQYDGVDPNLAGSQPTIEDVAIGDGGPTAAELFEGNWAGWSGNLLFPNLGSTSTLRRTILASLDGPRSLASLGETTELGSYDTVALLAAQQRIDLDVWSGIPDAIEVLTTYIRQYSQAELSTVQQEMSERFWALYGLQDDTVRPDPGNDAFSRLFGLIGAPFAANFWKSATYLVGTYFDDTLGYSPSVVNQTSLTDTGTLIGLFGLPVLSGTIGDVLNAGRGNDTVYGTAGFDVLDGGVGSDTLIYLPASWGGPAAKLSFRFDGKGRFPSRTVIEKPVAGGLLPSERDIAVDFEKLIIDYGAIQTAGASRAEIPDKAGAPKLEVDISGQMQLVDGQYRRSERVRISGNVAEIRGADVSIDLGVSREVASGQDVIDASSATAAVDVDLSSGRIQSTEGGWIPFSSKLFIKNANEVIGTQFDDILTGSAYLGPAGVVNVNQGQLASDPGWEGFSVLRGGAGNDKLSPRGYRTEMYGGSGADKFHVGGGGFIEDASTNDTVYVQNLRLYGGIKPWWMKSNYAIPLMFGGVASLFPVIGGSLIQAAATFLDDVYFSLAHFATGSDGSLAIRFGFGGKWSQTIVRNYQIDLDTGIGTAGLTVVAYTDVPARSREEFRKGVNLAMKAGFGVGLGGQDPIVLDLNGDGISLRTAGNSSVYFDYSGTGFGERTAWIRGGDGLVVRDLDGNGKIETLAEMFGEPGDAGFSALGAYDTSGDGIIDASDTRADELRVWVDANEDGVTQVGELKTFAEVGLQSISLAPTLTPGEQVAGSDVVARGIFRRTDGSVGQSAEVILAVDPIQTRYAGDRTISAEASLLPEHLGTGRVADLRVASTQDASLRSLLTSFASAPITDLSALKAGAEQVFLRWTSADGISPAALGSFDTRKLAALEALAGRQLAPRENGAPTAVNDDELLSLWNDTLQRFTLRLLVQGPLAGVFSGIEYIADRDLLLVDSSADLSAVFEAVLDGLPTDPVAAQSAWSEWASLLKPLIEDLSWRHDSGPILVDAGFALAALQNALQNSATSLTLAGLAPTLGYSNTLFGSNGNDVLTRAASGIATFVSSGGTDRFVGGGGQDFYLVGANAGQITIDDAENAESGDTLQFSTLRRQDVTATRDGQDLVLTSAVDSTVVRVVGQFADVQRGPGGLVQGVRRGVEAIMFADGALLETGLGQISQLVGTGTAAAETIAGTNRSDYLEGGAGDDTLRGGDDGDFYYYNAGDGNDVIQDVMTNPTVRATDMLMFGRNITPAEIAFGRVGAGDNLVITIGAAGQQSTITIEGQFGYDVLGTDQPFSRNYAVESFVFETFGETWSAAEVQQLLIAQTSTGGDDTTYGYGSNDEFFATAGNDLLVGLDGDDRYHWSAGAGNDTIDERARYVDVEVGLGGINLGVTADTVRLDGLARADVRFSRASAAPDLTVTIIATGETLTIKNQFAGFQTGPLGAQWMDRMEWFEFADGTRMSWRDVLDVVTTGSAQDDLLWGDLSVDTLDGGAGNDRLSGRGYGDLYVFKLGYGHDTIVDDNTSFAAPGVLELDTTPDILTFGTGISPSSITFARSGNDIDLIVNGSDRVTLVGQVAYLNTGVFGILSVDRIEEFRFATGETWSWSDLNRRVILSQTTAGNDVIDGFVLADRFEASGGNDLLRGGDSGDTYVFGFGSGQDRIEETVGNVMYGDDDVVEFGPGVRPQDVSVGRVGEDLIFTLTTGDTLRIVNQFGYYTNYRWNDVESFRFSDGTTWSEDDLKARLLAGTPGNDSIIGFSSPDTIRGGRGNDTLQGGDGGDTYLFDTGDGQDIIRETVGFVSIGDADRIRFGPGIALANLNFSRNDNDLTISIAGTSDQIRIEGQFNYYTGYVWNDVETLEFADGSTFTDAQIRALLTIGTAQAETITGFYSDDLVVGGAGNDVLRGGDGADTYRFELGFGHDRIEESVGFVTISDFDTIEFGPGITPADLVVTRDLKDIVISAFGGTDSIRIVGQQGSTSGFTWSDIERVRFSDGTEWSKVELAQKAIRATEAADNLLGSDGADVIDALGGNDRVNAYEGDDQIFGGAGNDELNGSWGNDVLRGGTGDDILIGGGGDDLYNFARGDGQDIIREFDSWNAPYSGVDELRFDVGIAPADISIAQGDNGRDIVLTIAGGTDRVTLDDAIVSGAQRIERITFADGTLWTIQDVIARSFGATAGADSIGGTEGADTLRGLGGNDTINARGGDDVLVGGPGDDLLTGSGQNDTYDFARGDGQDIIREYDSYNGTYAGDADRIRFGLGILPSDVTVTQADNGNDIRLTIAGTSDSITVDNAVSDPAQRVEQIVFENGTVWSFADLMMRATAATAGPDAIYGSELSDTLNGGGGNDTLDGRGGDDDLRGGVGNDLLIGSFGNDTYRFARGDGQDLIQEFNHWNTPYSGIDRILFDVEISPADIVVSQADSSTDIVLSVAGTQDRITIDGALTQAGQIIETVEFANGTVWSFTDLVTRSIGATDAADTLFGSVYDDSLVEGRGGNDSLNGRWGNDVLRGGAGNDTLTGSGGDDVYEFNRGDGIDVITEFDSWNTPYSGTDTIRFGTDIAPEDLVISLGSGGADLIFGVSSTADRITVVGGVSTAGQQVERFTFADGTFWSLSDVLTRANAPASGLNIVFGGPASDTLTGGSGNDLIDGRWGADILSGGAGSDTLIGGGGDDTYRFNIGDGADLIREFTNTLAMSGGNDVLEFGAGITPADVLLGISAGDLKLTINGTTDSITIVSGLSTTSQFVETIRFQDGTAWSLASIFDRLLSPGATTGSDTMAGTASADGLFGGGGSDTLRGNNGDDTLVGGLGNDTLEGGEGADRYIYLPGHGGDTIFDYRGVRDNRVVFGPGIVPSDLRFSRNASDINDVRVSFANNAGSILIDNQGWGDAGIEYFEFADGTVWDEKQISTAYVQGQSTAGNDVIWGTQVSDVINAGSGNDTVDGSGGEDTISGGAGDDTLQGSGGNDRYIYNLGDGVDTIFDYRDTRENRLIFGAGISPTSIRFTRVTTDFADIRINMVGQAGAVVLDNQLWGDAGVEFFEFADGTIWNESQMLSRYLLDQQTAGNDTIWGTYGADQMFGDAGNDLLESSNGDDLLVGGIGNDVLQGGRGNDTYRFARGDGQDIVREYFPNVGAADGIDEIQFAEGITPDDLVVKTANNGEHLVIEIAGTQDRITIEWEVNYGNQRVERFRFADGTVLAHSDMMNRAGTGTDAADTLFGSYDNELMGGLGGNDTLDGRGGNDTLSGGRGNDLVIGGNGDDSYLFERGDGQDVFREYYAGVGGASGNDTIQFGAGISPDDVLVTRANNGEHIVLSLAGTADRITLEWAVNYPTQRFERVLFADGTAWSYDTLLSKSSGQASSFYAVEALADSLAEAAAGFSAAPSAELDMYDPSWRNDEAILTGTGHYHRQRELQRLI